MMYKNPLEGWTELDQVYIPPRKAEGFTANVLYRDIWEKQQKEEQVVEEIPAMEEPDEENTVLLQEELSEEEEDQTVLLTSEVPEPVEQCAYIIRTTTNERIDIEGECFVIGKSQEADYQINGNDAISRRHVKVTKTDDKYYLEDLESSNHTYINDEVINGPMELSHQQNFKIADEEFQFLIGEKR